MKGIAHLGRLFALSATLACSKTIRFPVPFLFYIPSLSSHQRLSSCLMPQGKHNGKQQWIPKSKVGTAHAPASDIASGSSQARAPLSRKASQMKLSNVGQHDAVVDQLGELHLEPAEVDRRKGMSVGKREHQQKGKKGDVATPKKVKGTVAQAQLRATFYPKFENEKSDQEVRMRMQEVVGAGHGVLEVTMKHSGSLFLYAGDNGGAFAKNSYGNLYTAVGVYVLGSTLREAWEPHASQKLREFNTFLKEHRICVGMELVTAVLGDHGQRPLHDYVVVTAVTKLDGRPHFQSTPDVIAFCHQWRLPTNQYWLFSTKDSVISFFTAYDALCEEGLAGNVTHVLNDIADTYLPATKRHEDVQGEILEGLVARIVTPQSITILNEILVKFPRPPSPEASLYGKGLREICSSSRGSEKKQVEALLKAVGPDFCSDLTEWLEDKVTEQESAKKTRLFPMLETFLHSTPADHPTRKLQEMIQVIHKSKLPVRFKCHTNSSGLSTDDLESIVSQFKMTVHVYTDSAFRRYQKEMSKHPGLWPLYRGFFVDVRVYNHSAVPSIIGVECHAHDNDEGTRGDGECGQDDSVDETQNLMLKLKFLPYKIRTFLIRNGIATLFDKGVADYQQYFTRQMKTWGTSPEKQKELTKLLNEWASYVKKKWSGKRLSSNTYLTDAEPFLKQFAERSFKNQKLVGAAGVDIDVSDFLAIQHIDDEEYVSEDEHAPAPTATAPLAPAIRAQGMLVFFPGLPGCAKSALCKAIMTSTFELPMHSLMGDMVVGKYWPKLKNERVKKPHRITFADKNAPNKEVWQTIGNICTVTKAIGVPIVPESEGTGLNPYSLDVLAVFIFRVVQRTNHPGKLDKNTPNPGYVLLMFYNLYDGMDRNEFDEVLEHQFGHLVKMPVLKKNRKPMPTAVKNIIEEGLDLYTRHTNAHGRLESLHGTLKDEWIRWERSLKETMSAHKEYLLEVQVPFQTVVENMQQQLTAIANGDFNMHVPVGKEERSFRTFRFVAIALNSDQVLDALQEVSVHNPQVEAGLSKKNLKGSLGTAHITLAHKASHGASAVAAYAPLRGTETQLQLTALLFTENLAAMEVQLVSSGGEKAVISKNEWPHLTVWTGAGMHAKDANKLPQMVEAGEANRVDLVEPVTLTGLINFY